MPGRLIDILGFLLIAATGCGIAISANPAKQSTSSDTASSNCYLIKTAYALEYDKVLTVTNCLVLKTGDDVIPWLTVEQWSSLTNYYPVMVVSAFSFYVEHRTNSCNLSPPAVH